jgi:hypothetical protein
MPMARWLLHSCISTKNMHTYFFAYISTLKEKFKHTLVCWFHIALCKIRPPRTNGYSPIIFENDFHRPGLPILITKYHLWFKDNLECLHHRSMNILQQKTISWLIENLFYLYIRTPMSPIDLGTTIHTYIYIYIYIHTHK